MTGTREPQQDGSIQAMLRDSGLEAAGELRSALEQLRSLVPEQAPAPRADLAALLAAGSRAPEGGALPAGVTSLAARGRGSKRRLAVVGGAVVGAMALGAGAVAASGEDFRDSVHHTVDIIFQNTGETPDVAPKHAMPAPSDVPAGPVPAPPVPAVPVPAVPVPAVPAPAVPVPAVPAAGSRAGVPGPGAASPAASTPGTTRPGVGRGGVLPTPPRRPPNPGSAGIGDGQSLPARPLPEPTIPARLPGQP